ncbi:hypothetical protein BJ508DRAFT_415027 [Ascobolus immersus RN42]|uniref:Sulfatase N-terminal domain-containing protein n=1 Tax=Ascobolus immersus RN42 TaxID=1160509 RepID=A0A3N4I4G7_ASCIM|nr:hypothetical protein BJ508DRAFT_415027 [Ascobolus immersus RN42]
MSKPNFLIIVADDLGYSDLQPFGSEIDTPNLQALADRGLLLSNFYTASACSPTRSMLFSGTDNHIAGLGQMAEFVNWNPEHFKGQPGYEGYLNDKVAALPELLKDEAGYKTILSGKWHLGLEKGHWPVDRGFEKSFALLPGAGMHYKYFPGQKSGKQIGFMPPLYVEDDKKIDPEDLPDDFYSTDLFTDKILNYLSEHDKENASTSGEKKPFFAALTYTAPHWPLQAPRDLIDKYRGRYDSGPTSLRAARIANLQRLGLIPQDVKAHPVVAPITADWDDLPEAEKAVSARNMEVYAAMIERMDYNIGRVIEHLKASGELDNTLILFMSDNGAEGALLEAIPIMSDRFVPVIEEHFDNSVENIGNANSFTWYGPRWAQAATAPGRMYKAHVADGGIKCPAIISFPAGGLQAARTGTNGTKYTDSFTTVMDVLPTLLSLAGVQHPASKSPPDTFRGRTVAAPRGASWIPHLTSPSTVPKVHSDEKVTGWELFGQAAIRKGKWKALFVPKPIGTEKWQLYDIEGDIGETEDLAETEEGKKVLDELLGLWEEYVAETGTIMVKRPVEEVVGGGLRGYGTQ